MGTGIGLYSQANKGESRQAPGGSLCLRHTCDEIATLQPDLITGNRSSP